MHKCRLLDIQNRLWAGRGCDSLTRRRVKLMIDFMAAAGPPLKSLPNKQAVRGLARGGRPWAVGADESNSLIMTFNESKVVSFNGALSSSFLVRIHLVALDQFGHW